MQPKQENLEFVELIEIDDFRLCAFSLRSRHFLANEDIRLPARLGTSVDGNHLLIYFFSNMRFIYAMRRAIIFCDVDALNTVSKPCMVPLTSWNSTSIPASFSN